MTTKEFIKKSDYRKLMQASGFKVSFRTISFSDLLRKDSVVQVIKDLKGNEMPTMFYGEEHLAQWRPAIELKNKYNPI